MYIFIIALEKLYVCASIQLIQNTNVSVKRWLEPIYGYHPANGVLEAPKNVLKDVPFTVRTNVLLLKAVHPLFRLVQPRLKRRAIFCLTAKSKMYYTILLYNIYFACNMCES